MFSDSNLPEDIPSRSVTVRVFLMVVKSSSGRNILPHYAPMGRIRLKRIYGRREV